MSDENEDPWGFLPKKTSGSEPVTAVETSETKSGGSDSGVPKPSGSLGITPAGSASGTTEKTADDDWGFLAKRKEEVKARGDKGSAIPEAVVTKREVGEFRADMGGISLRRRAWPLAAALTMIFFAGFITEIVASSQMISLAGPSSILYIFPLGGLSLIVLGALQYRWVDGAARLKVLRIACLSYAVVITITLVAILTNTLMIPAIGLTWVLADLLNLMLPLLIWGLTTDVFNAAEGRKIFGWLVAWVYVGQVAGLGVSLVSPAILTPLGLPLTWLLVVAPVMCIVVAVWVPRAMKDSATAQGLMRKMEYRSSFEESFDFIRNVPVFKTMVIASTLTTVGGVVIVMGASVGAGDLLDRNAADLQQVFSGAWFAVVVVCWIIQHFYSEKIADRLGVPKTMIIYPIVTVIAGVLLAVGFGMSSLVVIVLAMSIWRVPRYSLDENARRGALTIVPDDKRMRTSYIVDMFPIAAGLILSAPIVAIGFVTGYFWISAVIAALLALAAIPFSRKVISGWDDSLMNWRLRRRKQNRTLDLT